MITGEFKLTYGKIELSSINTGARRRLAKKLVDIDEAYVISIDQEKNYLLILTVEGGKWRIIADTAADPSRGQVEVYREAGIDEAGMPIVCRAAARWGKDRVPGRPSIYDDEKEGQEIFVQHVYEGKSIRAIAADMHMSPSTVQKILNRVRMKVAKKMLDGELLLSLESPIYAKSLDVLRWAMKNSEGEEQEKYRQFLKTQI